MIIKNLSHLLLGALGAFIFFSLALLEWILRIRIPWILGFLLPAFVTTIILWKIMKNSLRTKMGIIAFSLILGFVISIIYSIWVHDIAEHDICYPAIYKKIGVQAETIKDPISKDGYYKFWYQHLECEDKILPFPWGKKAVFSDNPPGFIPVEASSENKLK